MIKTAIIWFGKTIGQTMAELLGFLGVGAGIFLIITGFINGLGHHSWEGRLTVIAAGCAAVIMGFGFYRLTAGRNKSFWSVLSRVIDDVLTGMWP